MQLHGRVQSVTIEESGDSLAADTGTGELVLQVYDAYDFSVTGGTVSVGVDLLNYTTCNYANNTITLASATVNAYFQDQSVRVYPYGETKIAIVALGEGEQGVRAAIPFEMVDRFRDGIRDPADQESVLIDDESGHWTVKSVDEEVPLVSGRYLDPTTIPTSEPGTPPPNSPAITVFGLPSSIMVKTDDDTVAQSTFIQYHISLTDGFTPGPTTLVHSGRDQVYVITQLHDGTPLATNTNYYLRTIAYNTAGAAAPSAQVGPVQLDLSVINSFVTQQLIAAIIVAAAITAGGVTVGNITLNPSTGITIPQPNGGVIKFPADGSEAVITAQLIATALTAKNNTILQDLVTLFGTIKVANGIVDPVIAPTVSDFWESVTSTTALETGADVNRGGVTDDAGSNWVVMYAMPSAGAIKVVTVNKTTGVVSAPTTLWASGAPGAWAITRMGTDYYVARQHPTVGAQIQIFKFNSSFVIQNSGNPIITYQLYGAGFQSTGLALGRNITSGNLLIAWAYSSTSFGQPVTIRTQEITTAGSVSGLSIVDHPTGDVNADVSGSRMNIWWVQGVERGTFDFGAARTIFAMPSQNKFLVFDTATTPAEQTSQEWVFPSSVVGFDERGVFWDGTRFCSFYQDSPGTTVSFFRHATIVDGLTTFSRYTWADVVGTLHETAASPSTTYVRKLRAGILVQGKPAPQAALSGADVANMVRIYIGDASADTRLQATQPAQGIDTMGYGDPALNSGAVAPTTNNWGVLGAVGQIQSTNYASGTIPTGWMLKGDGTMDGRVLGDSGWINMVLINSWVQYDAAGTPRTPQYRKINGVTHVKGVMKNGAAVGFWVCPAGFRPASSTIYEIVSATIANSGYGQVQYRGDTFTWETAAVNANYQAFTYLAGVPSWPADA